MKPLIKTAAIRRLKIIAGQLRGLENLLLEDKYCIDIIHQSLAVRKALISFEKIVLKNHLETHVIDQVESGHASRSVKEILSIYQLAAE